MKKIIIKYGMLTPINILYNNTQNINKNQIIKII